ncbi:MAG: NADPH:quinone oxidoreductase family protein [Novosphingobium sp.]
MKALLSYTPGKADTLRFAEQPEPVCGPDQVLVRVKAVSLNYPDALMIEDLYQFKPERPFAPGTEVAGVIETVGANVAGIKPGDRVCALCGHGGLAELVTADAWSTFVIPDEMPFDVASTMLMTYATNIHGLTDRAGLRAGDTMLVLGASGGVGTAAVELGKALGARVVGAASSPEKAEVARRAGADDVVVYPKGALDKDASRALANAFKAACPQGYDVIYDVIGGDYAEPALRSIGWEGRYMVIGFTAGIPKIPTNLALLKACSIVGVFWGAWTARNQARFGEEVAELFRLWREGKIKPLISQRFAFADAARALDLMANRGAIGKLVVSIG